MQVILFDDKTMEILFLDWHRLFRVPQSVCDGRQRSFGVRVKGAGRFGRCAHQTPFHGSRGLFSGKIRLHK